MFSWIHLDSGHWRLYYRPSVGCFRIKLQISRIKLLMKIVLSNSKQADGFHGQRRNYLHQIFFSCTFHSLLSCKNHFLNSIFQQYNNKFNFFQSHYPANANMLIATFFTLILAENTN